MTRHTYSIKLALLLLCLLCAVVPGHASDLCSPGESKRLDALDPTLIVGQIADTSRLGAATIKEVQSCLDARRCYANDPKDVDGIVGPYTTAALYRSLYHQCAAPAPPTPPPCGDGQEPVSYSLTALDIQNLQKPSQLDPAGEQDNTDASTAGQPEDRAQSESDDAETDTGTPAMGEQLIAGLAAITNTDYPTRELFENALTFFATQPLTNANDRATVEKELKDNKPQILRAACKPHPLSSAGSGWVPDWNASMLYSLSDPVYGFFPFWMSAPDASAATAPKKNAPAAPREVDFGVLERVGWVGVTFSGNGNLNLATIQQNSAEISQQIEEARRFRTSVDLVVYKQLTRRQWMDLAHSGSDIFIQTLSRSIANTVGAPLPGFLNRIQSWVLPGMLTSPVTAWDGVTLNLQGFPFDDPEAMQFLNKLLTNIRQELTQKQQPKTVWSSTPHLLNLNLIVPFEAFVPSSDAAPAASLQDTKPSNLVVDRLAQLVPKQTDERFSNRGAEPQPGIVDNFIVFLPQSTNNTKKQLRLAVEDAFNRNGDILQWLKEDPLLSIAAWRYQMLRRITYVLSPNDWNYKGVYSHPGGQFYDDMLYAYDNFGAVGFWPLPAYDSNNQDLATKTRQIFKLRVNDAIQTRVAPVFEKVLGHRVANFFCGWRRELFLSVEILLGLLLTYAICAYWIFELREFYSRQQWWFHLLFLLTLSVLVLLCLFDRELRDLALFIFIGMAVVISGALIARKFFLSGIGRDLP